MNQTEKKEKFLKESFRKYRERVKDANVDESKDEDKLIVLNYRHNFTGINPDGHDLYFANLKDLGYHTDGRTTLKEIADRKATIKELASRAAEKKRKNKMVEVDRQIQNLQSQKVKLMALKGDLQPQIETIHANSLVEAEKKAKKLIDDKIDEVVKKTDEIMKLVPSLPQEQFDVFKSFSTDDLMRQYKLDELKEIADTLQIKYNVKIIKKEIIELIKGV